MQYKSAALKLNDVYHWVHVAQEDKLVRKSEDYDEESDLVVVWETAVQPLTDVQRLTFLSLTIIVAIVAIHGNILVLYVNFSRFSYRLL